MFHRESMNLLAKLLLEMSIDFLRRPCLFTMSCRVFLRHSGIVARMEGVMSGSFVEDVRSLNECKSNHHSILIVT
jgi:hypothetical protein